MIKSTRKLLIVLLAIVSMLCAFSVAVYADEASCEHTGGTATCTEKAVCTKCGAEYGDYAHTNNIVTCDKDCDKCGYIRTDLRHVDEDGNQKCDYCKEQFGPSHLKIALIVTAVVLGVFLIAAGAFFYIWFVVKKQTWGDLVAYFKGQKQ